MTVTALLFAALLQAPASDALPPQAGLEGRPVTSDQSPVQALVDRARPGDRVVVAAGNLQR